MNIIKEQDIIESVFNALQYISYYHSIDFIKATKEAYDKEQSIAARDSLAQILMNARMCAIGKRPICQDTGMITAFVNVGQNIKIDSEKSLDDLINEGVRKAYTFSENILRASVLEDPAGQRRNTKDNTPAVIHYNFIPGDKLEIFLAAKGGGSENKTKMKMLNPSDSIVDYVLSAVEEMGAGWCPPGILGIGIGGSPEKAAILAKQSLLEPINIQQLQEKGAVNTLEKLRLELYEKVNRLGIGAQGVGGLTTVLDVKILDYPTHAASLPICIIPNCAATRHIHFTLDGSGPKDFKAPDLNLYPEVQLNIDENVRVVDLDKIKSSDVQEWRIGETILLNGKILTGRDAAHKRLIDLLDKGEKLPVDLQGKFIYYVGPVDPVGDEVVGPAGPTTSTRMDKFTRKILEQTHLLGMIGKSERGQIAIDAISDNKSVYLMAVGGAAYLVSKAIKKSRVLAFKELGMEAIYEFEVENMPVTVAVDSLGNSIHTSGPKYWKDKINTDLLKKNS